MSKTLASASLGSGPPVVCIHGLASSHREWRYLQPYLAASGYRTWAVDLLGHGESPKPAAPEAYHAEAFYQVFESWIESLDLDEPPWLVGHSLGGYLSLQYGLRHPERVRGLALLSPLYSRRQIPSIYSLMRRRPSLGGKAIQAAPDWLLLFSMKLDPVKRRRLAPQVHHEMVLDWKRASPHIYHLAFTISDLTARLSRVQAPAMVIWGNRDLTLMPASFPRLIDRLPHAESFMLPGCGHQPHLGRPDFVNGKILDFLRA